MSLYRKYRPQDFSTLKGQDHVREILQSALQKNRVSHAYLFTGPRGTGKTSTARILARAINCLDLKTTGPCNVCESCLAALEERLTDFIEIDAASHGLVEDARTLVEQARFMPTQAKKKIYLIDEVHMLSKSAFNALLKIIEEPPEHVHFILATTEAHKVLETIVSRCQRFDFHLADDELIEESLRDVSKAEGVKPQPEAIKLIAQHARGSFRDALSLLEQVIGFGNFTVEQARETLGISEESSVTDFVKALFSSNQQQAFSIIRQVHEQGGDLYQFCQDILRTLRKMMLAGEDSLRFIDAFFIALEQLKDPVIAELPLEMAVVKTTTASNAPAPVVIPNNTPARRARGEESLTQEINPLPPAERAVVSVGMTDPSQFISKIKPAALRSLMKFSHVEFRGQEIIILAKSPFELEKMKSRENQAELAQAMRDHVGEGAYMTFGIQEPPKKTGLQSKDLHSIF